MLLPSLNVDFHKWQNIKPGRKVSICKASGLKDCL
jgi:hypothetical protein